MSWEGGRAWWLMGAGDDGAWGLGGAENVLGAYQLLWQIRRLGWYLV